MDLATPNPSTLVQESKMLTFALEISGGDMAQAIKLQLLDINPKLKIFLDVDDLNIIHNLENNIIHSKNVILLVTDGAVKRPFVQLEICTAVKHNKNIIVVRRSWENNMLGP